MTTRVLVIGDAGCHTGFASVVHAIWERLLYEVHVLATNYLGDPYETPLRLYPAGRHRGFDHTVEIFRLVKPDLIWILNDPSIVFGMLLNNGFDREREIWKSGIPIMAYLPIDGENYPKMWDVLAERVTRVAMSEHGRTVMPEAPVIYHGVEPIFRPYPKSDAKRELGFPEDSFLVLRVDQNNYRKDYPATWRAVRDLMRRHTDVLVHFHCLPISPAGYNLWAYVSNDEDIRDRLTFSPQLTGNLGWPRERLALLYSAADCFVSTSHGEGFGLTLAEALACGTPVIAQDYSAIPEVVGPGGLLVPPGQTTAVPQGHEQRLPDVPGFARQLEVLYNSPGLRERLSLVGVEHVRKFDWDTTALEFDRLVANALQNTR